MPSTLHLASFGILVLLVTLSHGSLDGCTLYSGGDFIYSNQNEDISPGFLKYDLAQNTFQSIGNTYKDAHINSFIEKDGILYFSGNLLRTGEDEAMSIGALDLEENRLFGVSSGLWTLSNSLPTSNSEISPTILFAPKGDGFLVAGHFTHGISDPSLSLNNLAFYSPSGSTFSSVPQGGLCSECSIIALASVEDSNKIIIATMSTDSHTTQVYYLGEDESQWTTMESPKNENSVSLTILFNSFSLSPESLFAIAYKSESGLISDNSIEFYLVSWELSNLQNSPVVITLWEKNCPETSQELSITYPVITVSGTDVITSNPDISCPTTDSGISFTYYNSNLVSDTNQTIPAIPGFKTAKYFESANAGEFLYISEGTMVQMFDGELWATIVDNTQISAIHASNDQQKVFTAFHFGYEQSVEFSNYGSLAAGLLFTGDLYSGGTILAMAEISDDQFLIGGDFKYIAQGDTMIGAKFAALWDGSRWKATLATNDNNYLPGWRLLSIAATGDTVFGIADQGRDTDLLPLVRWRADDGWLFLYKRPEILDDAKWDNTIGTVHIDHARNQVYFGGEFTVGLASGKSCSGALIYNYLHESWEPLPANLTRVNTFGTLNNHEYMQVGGQFTYLDENSVRHENYLVLDIENQVFLSSVPSISDAEVFSVSLFPNQEIYSFIGGDFGQYGVEQLRNVGNIWSLSVVGNSPLKPTTYSLASRNEGESLFAGGSFDGKLAELDIGRQEWHSIIPSSVSWQGNVYILMLACPGDSEYYSVDSAWDDSSLLGSFYSVADCTIPIGAPDDFVCPTNSDSLSIGQMIGLGFTVLITTVILAVIGFFAYRQVKKQADDDSSVEYL